MKKPSNTRRALFLQPKLAPYRWTVFTKVIERFDGEIFFLKLWPTGSEDLPEPVASRLLNPDFNGARPKGIFRWDIIRAARDLDPDVIVMAPAPETPTQIYLFARQKLRGRKVIMWSKGRSPLRDQNSLRSRIVRLAHRIVSGAVDSYIGYGEESKDYFTQAGVDPNKIHVAQNTVDTEEIQSREREIRGKAAVIKKRLGLEGRKVILVLGALKAIKRVDLALECLKRIEENRDDVTMLVVGGGALEDDLRTRTSSMRLENCIFTGRVPLFEDNYYIAMSDVMLVPAGAGLAMNQAMLLGCPIVCADEKSADAELLIDGATGLRFPPGDVEAMVSAVERVLDEPGFAGKITDAAREHVASNAPVSKMADGILKAISAALENNN